MLGNYYFEAATENRSINSHLSTNYFLLMLSNLSNNVSFQKDRSPPPYNRRVEQVLNDYFSKCTGCKRRYLQLDVKIFLSHAIGLVYLGIWQIRVFGTPYKILNHLKQRITTAMSTLRENMAGNVWENVEERLNTVSRENCGDIEHLLSSINY